MLHAVPPAPETTKSSRAKNAYLTEDQMEILAEYLIKDRLGVETDIDGNFVQYRVNKPFLIKEARAKFPELSLGDHQIDKAIKWYIRMRVKFKAPIIVTISADTSVQEGIYKQNIAKLERELADLKTVAEKQLRELNNIKARWIDVKNTVNKPL